LLDKLQYVPSSAVHAEVKIQQSVPIIAIHSLSYGTTMHNTTAGKSAKSILFRVLHGVACLGQSLPISAWFLLFEFDFSALRARPAFSPLDNFSSSDLAHQYHWCTGFGTQWRLEHLHQAISQSNDELFASLDHGEVLASRN